VSLLDRIEERALLDALLDEAREGTSGALVLHGEAGMGKTALLDYAADRARDLQLVRVSGIEAEHEFGFAALHRLLVPFLGQVGSLPPPQRQALEAAFGLSVQDPADLFMVALATLTLLADAASSHGLLCLVDDVQWIDRASLQALAFVGRRLSKDGVALILGMRSSDAALSALSGLPTVEIKGLPDDAAIELLSQVVPGSLDPHIARRVVSETSGCPLALAELAEELTATQWVGASHLSEPIPISRRLEAHFRRQVDILPPEVQTFLLVAAAETSQDPVLVRRVATQLGCGSGVEELAISERLLTTEPQVEFRHPLIRSAVYAGASGEERRRVHHALAAALDKTAEPDRWAQHLIGSASGPNDTLAAEVEEAAHWARNRGGYAAEAFLLSHAADLTEDLSHRSARLLKASAAALNAGEPTRAEALLSRARSGLSDPILMAEAQQLNGRLRVPLVQPSAAPALLLDAARQFLPFDVERARESLLEAFDAYLISAHLTIETDGVEIAELARTTAKPTRRHRLADHLLDGTSLLLAKGYVEAIEEFRDAARIMRDAPISMEEITRWGAYGVIVSNELFDDRTYSEWAHRVESMTRDAGALLVLLFTLFALAQQKIRIGDFSAADAHYEESLEIVAAIGQPVDPYRLAKVELLAWRGDEADTRAAAKACIDVGTAIGSATVVFQAYRAIAILELGAGNYADALRAAEFATVQKAIGWTNQSLPLLVEAGVRSGDREAAMRALAELQMRATASGTPWALGLLARSQALLSEDATAEHFFQAALEKLADTAVVIDLAHTRLLYGEWLRRQKRRVDARVQLRSAYEQFSSMGAMKFAERSRLELAVTGEHVRPRTVGYTSELTPQERQIAELASTGETNREIAAKLFISANTVDYHLRKVFQKLGIASRRQLARALHSGGLDEG
jgi:DNA-binding CsgD family transcriptional regulator